MNKLTFLTPRAARALTLTVLVAVGVAPLVPVPRAFAKDAPAKSFNAALDASLIAAVNKSDAREVRKLLSKRANPNARDKTAEGTTALGRAATAGNLEIVKMLVEAGAEVESGSVAGLSPLAIAALNNRNEVLFYLLGKGANANSNGYKGLTALMFAASAGNADGVRALLRAGADVNARSVSQGTPLFFGSTKTDEESGTLEVVKILVEAGADLFATTNNGKNAFTMAQEDNLIDIANYLAGKRKLDIDLYNAGADAVNAVDAEGDSDEAWDDARQLLEGGAKGQYLSSTGQNALFLFAFDAEGCDETVAKRLISVSDINAQTTKGYSPLHVAADHDNGKMVALLIAAGAKLSLVDDAGTTPLDLAQRFPALATMLRNAGAQSGKTATVATTPATPTAPAKVETPAAPVSALDMALFEAMEKIYDQRYRATLSDADWAPIEKLLNEGANARYANQYGRTALIMASSNYEGSKGTDAMLKTLIARANINAQDDEGNAALHNAALYGNRKMVALLIEAGADLNLRNNGGKTARDWAVQQGDAVILDSLTQAAARQGQTPATPAPAAAVPTESKESLDAVDGEGKTALMRAATGGNAAEVARLLKAGASVDFVNPEWGGTALFSATWAGSLPTMKLLLDAGADINHRNNKGESVLEAYVTVSKLEVLGALIEAGIDRKYIASAIVAAKAENKQSVVDYLSKLLEAAPAAPPKAAAAPKPQAKPVGNAAAATVGMFDVLARGKFEVADTASAEHFLRDGGDILTDKNYGLTALMFASANGTVESVRWLLSKNVPVNAANALDMTALMYAAQRTDTELATSIIAELLKVNAKTKPKNKDGKTALDLANDKGNSDAADRMVWAMMAE